MIVILVSICGCSTRYSGFVEKVNRHDDIITHSEAYIKQEDFQFGVDSNYVIVRDGVIVRKCIPIKIAVLNGLVEFMFDDKAYPVDTIEIGDRIILNTE